MSSPRILITGANGFVGRHVVRRLLADDHLLTIATRVRSNLPSTWNADERISIVVTGPLEDATNLQSALDGVSTVVHIAGLAHKAPRPLAAAEKAFMRANAEATERLARASTAAGVRTFVHVSSLAAVSANATDRIVGDEMVAGDLPETPYGRSKRAAEEALAAIAPSNMIAVSLRPPLIVGGDAKGNWGSLQWLAATGLPLPFASVRNRRSLVGIDSMAQAISHLCSEEWPPELSGNYCIADGQPLSLPEIITELRSGMGIPPRLIPFPSSLLHNVASLLGQRRLASGLLKNLEVDGTRFSRAFRFRGTKSVKVSIRESGILFRRSRAINLDGGVE